MTEHQPEAVPVLSLNDLHTVASSTSWLWHGYLAPSQITLFTSKWETSNTTLAAMLLARLHSGGQLAGLPIKAGSAVLIIVECLPKRESMPARQSQTGS